MRSLKLLAAAIVLYAALSGCATQPRPAGSDKLAGAVSGMLAQRNSALERGDGPAFVADLDPANGNLVEHEQMVFENLRQLRFAILSYQLGSSGGVTLDASDAANTYHRQATLFLVRLRMQVADVDTAPAEARFAYLIAPIDGRPRIVGIDAVGPASRYFLPGSQHDLPWELTPLKVISQVDVILAGDGTVKDLDGLARAAADASVEVRRLWGERTAPKASLLFVTRNEDTFARWFGPARDLRQVEGLTFAVQGASSLSLNRPGFVGSRTTLNLTSSQASSNMSLLMRHELAHALTVLAQFPVLAATRTAGPQRWMVEGFARWVEVLGSPSEQQRQLDIVRSAARSGTFTSRLPPNEMFYSQSTVALNYAAGWSVFSLLQERLGVDKTVGVYADAVRLGSGGNSDFDKALMRAGMDPPMFTTLWQAYVRG